MIAPDGLAPTPHPDFPQIIAARCWWEDPADPERLVLDALAIFRAGLKVYIQRHQLAFGLPTDCPESRALIAECFGLYKPNTLRLNPWGYRLWAVNLHPPAGHPLGWPNPPGQRYANPLKLFCTSNLAIKYVPPKMRPYKDLAEEVANRIKEHRPNLADGQCRYLVSRMTFTECQQFIMDGRDPATDAEDAAAVPVFENAEDPDDLF